MEAMESLMRRMAGMRRELFALQSGLASVQQSEEWQSKAWPVDEAWRKYTAEDLEHAQSDLEKLEHNLSCYAKRGRDLLNSADRGYCCC